MTLHALNGANIHNVSVESIITEVSLSGANYGSSFRSDSDGSSSISGGRAQFRAYLDTVNQMTARNHGVKPASRERMDSILNRLAPRAGYGFRSDSGWTHNSLRSDSTSVFRDELTDRSGILHRPRQRKRALTELLPVRSVDPYAERFESRRLAIEGSVVSHKAGSTLVGNASSSVKSKKRDIHTFVTSTAMDWLGMLQGSRTSLDQAANDTYAVQELFADFLESLLVKGVGDAASLWGLKDIPAPRLGLSGDYTTTVDMQTVYNDFSQLIGRVQEVNEDRGDPCNTLILGSRLGRRMIPTSNITAGGSLVGTDLRRLLGNLFDSSGIERIVMAPALKNYKGNVKNDAAVICRLDGEAGLHMVSAMTQAPVRSASTLAGEQTLWAMRTGGLDINDATACAVIEVPVLP